MRAALPALLVLLVLPPAAAQLGEDLVVEVDGFPSAVRPLQDVVSARVSVTASCRLMVDVPPRLRVELSLPDAPPWVSAVVSPPEHEAQVDRCQDGVVRFQSDLVASVGPDAPAFRAAEITVAARVPQAQREAVEANATVEILPGWLGIVEARAVAPVQEARTGEAEAFEIALRNQGNGPARVSFELPRLVEGVSVSLPPAVRLGSRPTGEAPEGNATVRATLAEGVRRGSSVSFDVRWKAAYADDTMMVGGSGVVTLILRSEGAPRAATTPSAAPPAATPTVEPSGEAPPDDGRETPAAGALALAALALAARRARRRS